MRQVRAQQLATALASPEKAQQQLLEAILRETAQTQFGRAHGFEKVGDLAAFRAAVPVAGHDAFQPQIEAMLNGERDVLVPGSPIFFGRTSGSTGNAKHVGYPASTEGEYLAAIDPMMASLEKDHPGATTHALCITGTYKEATAPCGVTIGSASGFVRRLEAHRAEPYFHLAPEEICELADFEARYYAILRLALAQPLQLIAALNPSTLLTLFSKVEQHAEALVDDLRSGTVNAAPEPVRRLGPRLASQLTTRPDVADRLAASLRANGRFQPRDVWPDLKVLQTWKGGAAAHYLASLEERCPGCVVRSAVSGSTEGLLMVPLCDEWDGGVPALNSSVLEFFPERKAPESEAFVPISQLEEGAGYRVVLTNRRGLYRYLMDDVFVVEGRIERTPVMKFSHRFGLTSSLTGEKLTEPQVSESVGPAASALKISLTDYQVGPEWGEPPRYLLMIELAGEASAGALEQLLEAFEAGLLRNNLEYGSKRSSGRLAAPALWVLKRGEFERQRRTRAEARGSSDAQVKVAKLRRELVERSGLNIERVIETRPIS